MKRNYEYFNGRKKVKKVINYIPLRYIIAVLLTLFEILAIIGIVVWMCLYIPHFYLLAYLTQIACIIKIISSGDNPDYKVPWLLFVLILPVAGFMLYIIFYSRKLKKKYIKRRRALKEFGYEKDDKKEFDKLKEIDLTAYNHAKMLCKLSQSTIFTNTKQTYFPSGEETWKSMLVDLFNAKKFIYMEYFIIEEGEFWDSILEILIDKAQNGVEVKVLYDDIGCMKTLPGNYAKFLKKHKIEGTPFSRLKGQADSEFNNRSHRKMTIIDGYIGYTGGINIADEYINKIQRFGHWKDTAIRLEGEAVWEFTRLFLIDFGLNVKNMPHIREDLYPKHKVEAEGFMVPFGDGPAPLYKRRVGKSVIQNMVNVAEKYVYITTPYLIIDNELCMTLENAALRGVDVKIILPHVPDKKLIFGMTRSFYERLMKVGVKIYEYEKGFIHAKSYMVDGKYAMIGTINLDYRSLVHHFENGVWLFQTESIKDMEADFENTLSQSIEVTEEMQKANLFQRFIRAVVSIFSPML